ncbi:MAG: hypothetical protein GXP49_12685 [Deltaproteobacteria bacterium]|nr:hypothetical protein [Deltaproteobacteria bacterium]
MRKNILLMFASAFFLCAVVYPAASQAKEPKLLKLKKTKVLYDGPHPAKGNGWCSEQGLHFHDYGPVPSKGQYKTRYIKAYKFRGKVYWVCGRHPLDRNKLYEMNDKHMLLKRPPKFPSFYQFDNDKKCYHFSRPLHWLCGQHPIKGRKMYRKMYKKQNRHYWIGDPPGWPENYKKDSAHDCYTWKKPELKIKQPPTLRVVPKKDDKKKKHQKKQQKKLKEAGKKMGKRLHEAH